jgi:hypothetical protein
MIKVGQTVLHKTLGMGTIEGESGRYLQIRFGAALKTFVYPDAFASYLSATDPDLAAAAAADLGREREEEERRLAKKREEEKYIRRGVVIPGKGIRAAEEEPLTLFDESDEG